jgi:hypothetical protein
LPGVKSVKGEFATSTIILSKALTPQPQVTGAVHHPTMSNLSEKSSELLLFVFNALPSINDMLALSSTCRRMRQMWVLNALTIAAVRLPLILLCYTQAEQLAKDQEEVDPWLARYPGKEHASLFTFLRRIQRNANEAEWVRKRFEGYYMPLKAVCSNAACHDQVQNLTPQENARFTFGLYFSRCCVASYFSAKVYKFCITDIQKLSFENLVIACDVIDWMMCKMDLVDQERLEIPDPDPSEYLIDVKTDTAMLQWREAADILDSEFHARMAKIEWNESLYDSLAEERCECCGRQAVFDKFRKQPVV